MNDWREERGVTLTSMLDERLLTAALLNSVTYGSQGKGKER